MKRAVITIATTEYQQIHAITEPRLQAYANQVDADYIVVQETQHDPPHFVKYDLIQIAAQSGYDQVLYVDADIHIRQQAPNIFDRYKTSAVFNEIPFAPRGWVTSSIDWIKKHIDPSWPANRYYNTGVMVLDGSAIHRLSMLLQRVEPLPGVFFEQEQLNVLLQDTDCPQEQLDQCWNQFCQYGWLTPEKAEAAFFLHVAGGPIEEKLDVVLQIVKDYP